MTEKGNSATMQGIRILQSWNCVLEDCKVAKIIDIAMLRCWEKAVQRRQKGGEKPPRPLGRKGLRSASVGAEQTSPGRLAPPEGAKALLIERSMSKVLLRFTFAESNKGGASPRYFPNY